MSLTYTLTIVLHEADEVEVDVLILWRRCCVPLLAELLESHQHGMVKAIQETGKHSTMAAASTILHLAAATCHATAQHAASLPLTSRHAAPFPFHTLSRTWCASSISTPPLGGCSR